MGKDTARFEETVSRDSGRRNSETTSLAVARRLPCGDTARRKERVGAPISCDEPSSQSRPMPDTAPDITSVSDAALHTTQRSVVFQSPTTNKCLQISTPHNPKASTYKKRMIHAQKSRGQVGLRRPKSETSEARVRAATIF